MTDPRTARADALLGTLTSRRGAALKVFLGAAPGVGKTYAMLTAARDLQRQGIDVVVGLIETHGRAETQALLDGLELLPRRHVDYRDRILDEFDLDAALERKPALILVDELAHRNAPGSRHASRWQDIVELLDAGIDVYSTVNIQHLESLNDVVRQLTGIRVSETVPDAFLDRARDLVLVDLPPRELIDRLKAGKVYVPEQAAAALQRFFSASNLTALRELAVQQVADRVDSDLREQLTAQGVTGAVPIRRRVMIAIDGFSNSDYLVRAGRRIAERRNAPWVVVWVDRGRENSEQCKGVAQAFALARRLGGDTETLHGVAVVDQLLGYAQRAAVSTIVIGRTRERPWARMVNRTLTQRLLQRGAHIELTILATPQARAESRRGMHDAERRGALPWRQYLRAAAVSGIAVAVGVLAERYANLNDLTLVFITAVMIVATRSRMPVAVFAAVLCFTAYNFFFTEPRHTLIMNAHHDVVTAALFLIVALICGRLATRLREQVVALRAANGTSASLRALAQRLATAADAPAVLNAATKTLHEQLQARIAVLVRDPLTQALIVTAAVPVEPAIDGNARAAADWCFEHRQPAGLYTDTLQSVPWWFVPLVAEPGVLGVLALQFDDAPSGRLPELQALAQAMAEEVAQALGRVQLVDALEAARVQGETERLRAALLASVSHDLRSPLAAIVGSAESLVTQHARLADDDRRELASGILAEGQRLDRYIQNLLDMTRLGHGTLKLDRDWIGIDELVGSAIGRVRKLFPKLPIRFEAEPGLPLLYVHPALVEQALFNILENAARFSPAGQTVRVGARREDERIIIIDVDDRGPGIPEAERRRIFDIFYTAERGDRSGQGTGLGLTICQGMIGAHGGSVEALPGPGGLGTTIRVRLPLLAPPEHEAGDVEKQDE